MDEVNAADLTQELFAAKYAIDAALRAYEEAITEDADADRASRLATSSSYITMKSQLEGKPSVAEIEAHVDQATADVQHRARMAEGLKRAASQTVESRRQWLSALQSLASLTKAEAQLAKWEPTEVSA